jgi:hypothetical protein
MTDQFHGSNNGLPDDWVDQVFHAYEVFGVTEFRSRHITPAMRAGWAKLRRRGRGFGGGQFMPNVVARIPIRIVQPAPPEPEPELPPEDVATQEELDALLAPEEEDDEDVPLETFPMAPRY